MVEHIGTTLATTSYAYDALNDLATTTDSQGNIRNFTYDGLGRRLSAQDLHAPGHTPFGTWYYSYDPAGNVISQTDPKGSTTTRTYDALNRLLTENNASTTQITNTYDSCANGIGYLCVSSTTASQTQNAYDILGRIAFATTTIAGNSYANGYTYDRQSNVLTLSSPNNIQTQYGYNLAGMVSSINAIVNASSTPIETIASYAPTGKPSLIQYPTGVSTTYTYDPAHLYRLTRIFAATTTSVISTSTVPVPLPISVLVVGGGGTGANAWNSNWGSGGGGGGGGQVFSTTSYSVIPQAYTVTIGNGGQNSSFNSIVAFAGSSGGFNPATGGTSASGEPGGSEAGNYPYDYSGGGGGGDSTTGSNAGGTTVGGNGGNGTASSMSGTLTYYGGGGGGGNSSQGSGGTGGNGGGGIGGNDNVSAPSAGAPNTGGGGGGAGGGGAFSGAIGGSGIVILSYPTGLLTAAGGTTTTVGSSTIQTFTSNGTFQVLSTASTTATTTTVYTHAIQDLNYTYDPVGNITQIVNAANNLTAGTTTYTYDNLNRLLSAAFTPLSTSSAAAPYNQAFTYDLLGNIHTLTNSATQSLNPTVIATSADRAPGVSTSDSFAFNAGATSTNTLLVVAFAGSGGAPTSATYNGQSLTIHNWTGQYGTEALGYLVNPAPGSHVFNISYPNQASPLYRVLVLSNINQTTPVDIDGQTSAVSSGICSKTLTTTTNDLLFAATIATSTANPITEGLGQSELWQSQPYGSGAPWWAAATKPAATPGSQTMSFTFNVSTGACDEAMAALEVASTTQNYATTTTYAYTQTGFANPDAPTAIGNNAATTTYSFDANGNAVQAGGWNYMWDYLNRMLASGFGNSTTTYAYDAFGSRVLQTSTTSTTYYPNKYFSIASTIVGSTTYATSTNYIWNGDTLAATIDQPMINGSATGSPITRFIHPDHLGSTNAVTDQSGTPVQLLDYYPYGATRISSNTYPTNEKRQYIGQYSDTATGLSYLNARYYNPYQGQFLSQDPVFLGQPNEQNLQDPQSLNAYSYSRDNPIVEEDPFGRDPFGDFFYNAGASLFPMSYQDSFNQGVLNLSNNNTTFNFSITHPYLTSGAVSIGAVSVGVPALEAYETYVAASGALEVGNTTAAAVRILPFLAYTGAATGNLFTLQSYFNEVGEANSTGDYGPLALESALRMAPAAGNAYGALTPSLLVSNLSTGAASLSTMLEDLNYASLALRSLSTSGHSSQTSNTASVSASGSNASVGGSSGGAYGSTGLPAGYHTACGTLCR